MQQPDFAQLARLAQSPAGQQLLALLQKNSDEALQTAAAQVSAGDLSQAGKTLAPLLDDPEIKKLLQQLGGNP